jgi:hypothetical protein
VAFASFASATATVAKTNTARINIVRIVSLMNSPFSISCLFWPHYNKIETQLL